MKKKVYFRASVLGDDSKIAELESKKSENLIVIYVTGVALGGHMELVERMLEKGADPDMGLAGAAAGGHMELVELMLEKGANPTDGLSVAARGGHKEIVKLLLEKGADDNQLPAEFVMDENA